MWLVMPDESMTADQLRNLFAQPSAPTDSQFLAGTLDHDSPEPRTFLAVSLSAWCSYQLLGRDSPEPCGNGAKMDGFGYHRGDTLGEAEEDLIAGLSQQGWSYQAQDNGSLAWRCPSHPW